MKINGWLLNLVLGFFAVTAGHAQTPPPNDNLSNRTVLSGTDLTFSGTLAGATVENFGETVTYLDWFGVTPTQSVWWSWTPPVSTELTLEMLGTPSNLDRTAFVLYGTTNGGPDPLNLTPLTLMSLDPRVAPLSLSIPVVAGDEYVIQLIGTNSASYTARLIATNTPVIVRQPRGRAAYSNTTALFYVESAGGAQTAFNFQWYFNGTNLPNEIGPMLALSNLDSSMAGAYSVMVSNSAGFTLSQPAMLTVSQSNVPISLAVTGADANSLRFSLTGENGRSYRLESSTDLANWTPDLEFVMEPFLMNQTSVVFTTNSPLGLTVANNSPRKFFRATPYAPAPQSTDVCDNHLEQVRIAKMLWQKDSGAFLYYTPTPTDLAPYFPRRVAPFCPFDTSQSFDTSYQINDLQVEPECLIISSAHALEAPR